MLSFGYAVAALWPEQAPARTRGLHSLALLTVACALAKPELHGLHFGPPWCLSQRSGRASRSQIDWRLLILASSCPPRDAYTPVSLTFSDSQIPASCRKQPHRVRPAGRHEAILVVVDGQAASLALFPCRFWHQFRRVRGGFRVDAGMDLFCGRAGMMYLLAESGAENDPREHAVERADRAFFILFVQSAAHISAYFGGALATATQWERRRAMASSDVFYCTPRLGSPCMWGMRPGCKVLVAVRQQSYRPSAAADSPARSPVVLGTQVVHRAWVKRLPSSRSVSWAVRL